LLRFRLLRRLFLLVFVAGHKILLEFEMMGKRHAASELVDISVEIGLVAFELNGRLIGNLETESGNRSAC